MLSLLLDLSDRNENPEKYHGGRHGRSFKISFRRCRYLEFEVVEVIRDSGLVYQSPVSYPLPSAPVSAVERRYTRQEVIKAPDPKVTTSQDGTQASQVSPPVTVFLTYLS